MAKRGYGDTFPETPEQPTNATGGSFGTGGIALRSIRTPTTEERAKARRYLERVTPDLIDVLGLA